MAHAWRATCLSALVLLLGGWAASVGPAAASPAAASPAPVSAVAAAVSASGVAAASIPRPPTTLPAGQYVDEAACATPTDPLVAKCLAVARVKPTDARLRATPAAGPVAGPSVAAPDTTLTSPSELRAAYGLGNGLGASGVTVAIVDGFDAPAAESDLNAFRAYYGMRPCTTGNGCFRKMDQNGNTVPAGKAKNSTVAPIFDDGWATEATLDIEAVSATCPSCHIWLVEANTALITDLGAGVKRATTLGAKIVSNSYGVPEAGKDLSRFESPYNAPGVAMFAATGDLGYGENLANNPQTLGSAEFPATSSYVLAVGGTTLTLSSGVRHSETAWKLAGSGCSAFVKRPPWQITYFAARGGAPSCVLPNTTTPARAVADLSAVADPSTGLAVFRADAKGGPWIDVGGTSLATPVLAAIQALAGVPRPLDTASSYPYTWPHSASLRDVTSGTNGTCSITRLCTSSAGWDGPTGLGVPLGVAALGPALKVDHATSVPGGAVTVTGRGFDPGERVTLTTAGGADRVATATQDGAISSLVTLPRSVGTNNSVTIAATGGPGHVATVAVAVPPAQLTITPNPAAPGALIIVTGTGFAVGEAITVSGGVTVAPAQRRADNQGIVSVPAHMPTSASGQVRVVVTGADSGRTVTATATN